MKEEIITRGDTTPWAGEHAVCKYCSTEWVLPETDDKLAAQFSDMQTLAPPLVEVFARCPACFMSATYTVTRRQAATS